MDALRAFEAAARLQSFTRAADELCVTQGAISWHVRRLEASLSVPLFKRQVRAIELTEFGKEYLPAVGEAFDMIEHATLRMKRTWNSRALVVDVLPTFAMRWLVPRLPSFNKQNPDVQIHLLTSINAVDFQRDDVDLAIRVGNPPAAVTRQGPGIDLQMVTDWSGVHADLLMQDVLVPVCRPDFFVSTKAPALPRDLLGQALLHTATRERAWPEWFQALGIAYPEGSAGSVSFGHFFMALQAAAEGLGIALVPSVLTADDLKSRRLVIALNTPVQSSGAYYLLHRASQTAVPTIRKFRNWLLDECNAEAQWQSPRAGPKH